MKFLRNLLNLILIVIVLLVIGRWYLGGFSTPVATEKPMSPYLIAYVNFTGEYSKVGPVMTKLYDALSGAGIVSLTGIGIYYTDPTSMSGKNLQSDVGAVIAPADSNKLDKKSADYKVKVIVGGNEIVVEFPLKNSFSYMVGPIKAYPVMNAYIKEKGYNGNVPRTEFYDMTAKKIYYMADIVK